MRGVRDERKLGERERETESEGAARCYAFRASDRFSLFRGLLSTLERPPESPPLPSCGLMENYGRERAPGVCVCAAGVCAFCQKLPGAFYQFQPERVAASVPLLL